MPENVADLLRASKNYTPPSTTSLGTVGGTAYENLPGLSRYTRDPNFKDLNYSIFKNNEYLYEDRQSTGDYWKNTFNRFLHPLTNQFTQGWDFKSTIDELSGNKDMSKDEDLIDYVKTSKELQDLYPIYENPYTKDGFSGYFSKGASYKWSSIMENSGFMIGAAATGIIQSIALSAITAEAGGVGGVLKAASVINRMARIHKISTLAKAYKQVNSLAKAISPGYKVFLGAGEMLGAKTVLGAAKGATKFLGNAAIRFQQSSSEAMIEAIEGSEHFKQQQLEEFELQNGRSATKEEKDEIDTYAAELFKSRYRFNVGVLSLTNLLQDYNIFNTFKSIQKANSLTGMAEKASKRLVWSKSQNALVNASALPTAEKALYLGKKFVEFGAKNILSEGLEESAQYAIDKATNDYYDKKYNKQSLSFIESTQKGISSAMNDREGKEAFWSGIIMAGLFSGVGAGARGIHVLKTGQNSKVNELANDYAKRFNEENEKLKNLIKTETILGSESENAILNHVNNTEAQEASKTNNKKEIEEIKRQTIINAVKTAKDTGKYDIFIDKLFKGKDNISQEEKDKLVYEIETVKKQIDIIDKNYENPYQNYENINPVKDKVKRQEQFIKYKAFEEAKMVLVDNYNLLEDSHKKSLENNSWFSSKGIQIEELLPFIVSVKSKDKAGNTFDEAENIRNLKRLDIKRQIAIKKELIKSLGEEDTLMLETTKDEIENLNKELSIYNKISNSPENKKNWVDLINFNNREKTKNSLFTKDRETLTSSTELLDKVNEAVELVAKNQVSLKAINYLEEGRNFEGLAKEYETKYQERYNQVAKDLGDIKEDETPTEKTENITDAVKIEEIRNSIKEKLKANRKNTKWTEEEKAFLTNTEENEEWYNTVVDNLDREDEEKEKNKKDFEEKLNNISNTLAENIEELSEKINHTKDLIEKMNKEKDQVAIARAEQLIAKLYKQIRDLIKEAQKQEEVLKNTEKVELGDEKDQSELTDKELEDMSEENYSTLDFGKGLVYKTTALEKKDKKIVATPLQRRQANIKNKISDKLNKEIFITLQRADIEFYEDEDKFLSRVEPDAWPIVAVLTDENGKTLYFNDNGDIVSKETANAIPIVSHVYETRDDKYIGKNAIEPTIAGRKKNRANARKISEETIEFEFHVLGEIKNSIRDTNAKHTLKYSTVSRGFDLSTKITNIPLTNSTLEGKIIEIALGREFITEQGMQTVKPGMGYMFMEVAGKKVYLPIQMPKLSSPNQKKLIDKILERAKEIMAISKEDQKKEEKTEFSNILKFLNSILYTTKEGYSTKGLKPKGIIVNNKTKQIEFAFHDKNTKTIYDLNLRVNIDQTTLGNNLSIIPFTLEEGELVMGKSIKYSKYLRSIASVNIKEEPKEEDKGVQWNIVFGFNEEEIKGIYENITKDDETIIDLGIEWEMEVGQSVQVNVNTRGGGETREELVNEINNKYNKELENLNREEVVEIPEENVILQPKEEKPTEQVPTVEGKRKKGKSLKRLITPDLIEPTMTVNKTLDKLVEKGIIEKICNT